MRPRRVAAARSSERTTSTMAEYRRTAAAVPANHPLAAVLDYARKEQTFLREIVRDFTGRLVKRERIYGDLQDYQYIDMQLREEVRDGGQVVSPLGIFMEFVGPADVLGRRVLYVAGENEGKMLVRNGGKRFKYVIVKLDPLAAMTPPPGKAWCRSPRAAFTRCSIT